MIRDFPPPDSQSPITCWETPTYHSPRDLLDALNAAPGTLTALLTGVTQAKALAATGGDEGWSVVEVLCHLRDAEEIAAQRAALMRDHDNPDIAPYNQEQLTADRNDAREDMHAALFAFLRFRRQHIARQLAG